MHKVLISGIQSENGQFAQLLVNRTPCWQVIAGFDEECNFDKTRLPEDEIPVANSKVTLEIAYESEKYRPSIIIDFNVNGVVLDFAYNHKIPIVLAKTSSHSILLDEVILVYSETIPIFQGDLSAKTVVDAAGFLINQDAGLYYSMI